MNRPTRPRQAGQPNPTVAPLRRSRCAQWAADARRATFAWGWLVAWLRAEEARPWNFDDGPTLDRLDVLVDRMVDEAIESLRNIDATTPSPAEVSALVDRMIADADRGIAALLATDAMASPPKPSVPAWRIPTPGGSVDPSPNLRPRGEPSLARHDATNSNRRNNP